MLFPSILPNCSQQYGASVNPMLAVTQFETNFRQRKRYSNDQERIQARWLFTQLEFDIFKKFVRDNLANGSDSFFLNIISLEGLQSREVKMIGGKFSAQYVPHAHYNVSCELLVENNSVMSSNQYNLALLTGSMQELPFALVVDLAATYATLDLTPNNIRLTADTVGLGGSSISAEILAPSLSATTAVSVSLGPYASTARDSSRAWSSIASSSDGTKLVACVNGGQIYTSTNSGETWTARDSSRDWSCVASSADGVKLMAGTLAGSAYISTNSGVSWTANIALGSSGWKTVAIAGDGASMLAARANNFSRSSNGGTSWTELGVSAPVKAMAVSPDGTKILIAHNSYNLYTSTNSGTTMTSRDSSRAWSGAAMSSDGVKMFACVNGGYIYRSTNSGTSFSAVGPTAAWVSVSSSADGVNLTAVVSSGQVWVSNDSGLTWTARDSSRGWTCIAISSDGRKAAATVTTGQIYTISPGDGSAYADTITITPGEKSRLVLSGEIVAVLEHVSGNGTSAVYSNNGLTFSALATIAGVYLLFDGYWSIRSVSTNGAPASTYLAAIAGGAWPDSAGLNPFGLTVTVTAMTSNESQVIAAVNASPAASALVTATATGDVSGSIEALTRTNFENVPPGLDATPGSFTNQFCKVGSVAPFLWYKWNGSVWLEHADIPLYANLAAANAALPNNTLFYDTTLEKLYVTTA